MISGLVTSFPVYLHVVRIRACGVSMERSVDIDRYAIWNNFTISGFVTSFPVYLHVVRIRACEVSMERSFYIEHDVI